MNFNNINIADLVKELNDAPAEEKAAKIMEIVQKVADNKYTDITAQFQRDYREYNATVEHDKKFGLRTLNTKEEEWIERAIIKQETSLTGNEMDYLPQTTVDYIFEDLQTTHPLFEHINWAPAGVQKWFLSEKSGFSTWGKLTRAIVDQIEAGIETLDLTVNALTAFMFVPKPIVEMGYKWIDKFVRTVLLEVNEEGLETGSIAGNGKDSPIGLLKNLNGSVVDGVYPDKTAVSIIDFGPDSFGANVLPILNRNGARTVNTIVIIANQAELDTTIFKATHVLGFNGYVKSNDFKNFVFIPSKAVPAGKAIAYISKKYTMGIERMGIDFSDHYKFLEQMRTYVVATRGNGRLIANDDAVVLNITGLVPLVPFINANVAGAVDSTIVGTVNTVSETFPSLTLVSAEGTVEGDTLITVTETLGSGNSYKYKLSDTAPAIPAYNSKATGYTAWNGLADITAATGKIIAIVEVDSLNRIKAFGTAEVVSNDGV